MDYGLVLKRAWQTTWKFKGLWILGILASCSSGGGGGGGGGGSSGSGYRLSGQERQLQQFQRWVESIPPETWVTIAVVAGLAILVLSVLFLVLGIIGQGGLIAGFNKVEDSGAVTLSEAFSLGASYFWKLLGVRALFWLAGLVVGLLLVGLVVLVGVGTFGIGLLCLLPLLCLVVPIALFVGVYVMLTQVALVTENLSVTEAFSRSWSVLKANLGPVIIVGLIVVIGSMVVGLVIALPLVLAVLPALTGLAFGSDGSTTTGLVLAGLCVVLYLPVMIVLNGILQTYVTGVWTLSYRQWIGKLAAPEAAPAPSAA